MHDRGGTRRDDVLGRKACHVHNKVNRSKAWRLIVTWSRNPRVPDTAPYVTNRVRQVLWTRSLGSKEVHCGLNKTSNWVKNANRSDKKRLVIVWEHGRATWQHEMMLWKESASRVSWNVVLPNDSLRCYGKSWCVPCGNMQNSSKTMRANYRPHTCVIRVLCCGASTSKLWNTLLQEHVR